MKIGLLPLLIVFSCSTNDNFEGVDRYTKRCVEHDSLFSLLHKELISDTLYVGKHITNDPDKLALKNLIRDFKYSAILDTLGIYDILVTQYSVEFRLRLIDDADCFNIWYVYRKDPIEERKTESVYIKKVSDGKYIVAELY